MLQKSLFCGHFYNFIASLLHRFGSGVSPLNWQSRGKTMSVRKVTWKNKNGKTSERWLVDYVDQDGTRCAKNFKSKKVCLNTESRGGLGLPPQDVQRLLGHSSIVMTLDVYGHLFPGGDHHSKFAAGTRAIFA
jgi:hypothetical protein